MKGSNVVEGAELIYFYMKLGRNDSAYTSLNLMSFSPFKSIFPP